MSARRARQSTTAATLTQAQLRRANSFLGFFPTRWNASRESPLAPVPSGAFFSVQLFVCAIPKEGTPSLRFCKGGRRCCWGYLICYAARGMINSQVQAFPCPALRKRREGRRIRCVADASEIKSLGHPPSDSLVSVMGMFRQPSSHLCWHSATMRERGSDAFINKFLDVFCRAYLSCRRSFYTSKRDQRGSRLGQAHHLGLYLYCRSTRCIRDRAFLRREVHAEYGPVLDTGALVLG